VNEAPELYEKTYLVVRQIPAGMVSSYSDIAQVVGGGCDARTVGYALGELGAHAKDVPWQRVVSRDGTISTRGLLQAQLLVDEGVAFDRQDRVLMARHRWPGPTAEWAAAHGVHMLPPRPPEPEQLPLFQ
jgi:methylated-DNA-protein-cysteine methyltransferase-like protein